MNYTKGQISYTNCPSCFARLQVIDAPGVDNDSPDAAIELHVQGCAKALHDPSCDPIFARIRNARKFENAGRRK